jgi:hypothetical protein
MDSNSLQLPTTNRTLHEVHAGLAAFGYVLEEGDIIGATPRNNQATNNSTTSIVVTYRNPKTKTRIVKAAQNANIWNLPIPTRNVKGRGNVCSFREVTTKRHRTKAERKTDNRVAKFLSSCKFYTTSTTKIPSEGDSKSSNQ